MVDVLPLSDSQPFAASGTAEDLQSLSVPYQLGRNANSMADKVTTTGCISYRNGSYPEVQKGPSEYSGKFANPVLLNFPVGVVHVCLDTVCWLDNIQPAVTRNSN